MLFRNMALPQQQLIAGQAEKGGPSATKMESDRTHPLVERGSGPAAEVHAARTFNQGILAEPKTHFNARIATKA